MLNKIYAVTLIMMTTQILYAGCGGCRTNRSHSASYSTQSKGLIDEVPVNKFVKGNVMVSCGMCNFMTKDSDCTMAVKIGKDVYSVSGLDINAHGDSHDKDGYCNVIKKVNVEGRVAGKKFIPVKMNGVKI